MASFGLEKYIRNDSKLSEVYVKISHWSLSKTRVVLWGFDETGESLWRRRELSIRREALLMVPEEAALSCRAFYEERACRSELVVAVAAWSPDSRGSAKRLNRRLALRWSRAWTTGPRDERCAQWAGLVPDKPFGRPPTLKTITCISLVCFTFYR